MFDDELDRFKRDVHLVQYAAGAHGYQRDQRESSRVCHVLRHPANDDKIVVSQRPDGHWTYFSVRDGADDKGTVIDFLANRSRLSLGEIRKELRDWLRIPRPEVNRIYTPPPAPSMLGAAPSDRTPAKAFSEATLALNSHYLNARGIRAETLQDPRFRDSWRLDARRNVVFAHRDDYGAVTGFEIKNRGFTGFAPGGTKSVWRSQARESDRTLVITESAIDALSYHQLHRERAPTGRYLSTAGTPGAKQLEQLHMAMARMPATSVVVAAVDADVAGEKLAKQLEAIAVKHWHLRFERHAPTVGKDWNDVLQQVERDYVRSLPLSVRSLARTGLSR